MTIDVGLVARSLPDAVGKLDPRRMWRTPVMFATLFGHTEIVALLEAQAPTRGRWLGVRLSKWVRLTSRLRRHFFSRRAVT